MRSSRIFDTSAVAVARNRDSKGPPMRSGSYLTCCTRTESRGSCAGPLGAALVRLEEAERRVVSSSVKTPVASDARARLRA